MSAFLSAWCGRFRRTTEVEQVSTKPAQQKLRNIVSFHSDGFYQLSPFLAQKHLHLLRVIDVREPEEFEGFLGHIQKAELVPLTALKKEAKQWEKDQPFLLVCHSGKRAAAGSVFLIQQGFTQVYHLQDGMRGWNAQNLEVEGRNLFELKQIRDEVFLAFVSLHSGTPEQVKPLFWKFFKKLDGDPENPTLKSLQRLLSFVHQAALSSGKSLKAVELAFGPMQETLQARLDSERSKKKNTKLL